MPAVASTRAPAPSETPSRARRGRKPFDLRLSGGARIACFETHAAERRKRETQAALIEGILRGLAHYRTGSDDIDLAFERDEVRRLRSFLAFASDAKSEVVRSRRKSRSART